MKQKNYKLKKTELKTLPINYHYFEHAATKQNQVLDLIKQVPRENIFMTPKKYIVQFYKPISKCM